MYIGVANRDCDVPGSRVLSAYIDEFMFIWLECVCYLVYDTVVVGYA